MGYFLFDLGDITNHPFVFYGDSVDPEDIACGQYVEKNGETYCTGYLNITIDDCTKPTGYKCSVHGAMGGGTVDNEKVSVRHSCDNSSRVCCKAMTASCLSCDAKMCVHDYCDQNPDTVGCPCGGDTDQPRHLECQEDEDTPGTLRFEAKNCTELRRIYNEVPCCGETSPECLNLKHQFQQKKLILVSRLDVIKTPVKKADDSGMLQEF